MKANEQRIALAEYAGWKWNGPDGDAFKYLSYWTPPNCTGRLHDKSIECLPDYHTDLNALHELEKTLTYTNGCPEQYGSILSQIVLQGAQLSELSARFKILNATAPQRCEALLRIIGKWA